MASLSPCTCWHLVYVTLTPGQQVDNRATGSRPKREEYSDIKDRSGFFVLFLFLLLIDILLPLKYLIHYLVLHFSCGVRMRTSSLPLLCFFCSKYLFLSSLSLAQWDVSAPHKESSFLHFAPLVLLLLMTRLRELSSMHGHGTSKKLGNRQIGEQHHSACLISRQNNL